MYRFPHICTLRRQLTYCDSTTGLPTKEMTSERQAQNFHIDDVSLPWCDFTEAKFSSMRSTTRISDTLSVGNFWALLRRHFTGKPVVKSRENIGWVMSCLTPAGDLALLPPQSGSGLWLIAFKAVDCPTGKGPTRFIQFRFTRSNEMYFKLQASNAK